MSWLSTWKNGTKYQILCLVIAFSLIIGAGVATAAPISEEAETSVDCPVSLVTLGEDLWEHVPEFPNLSWDFGTLDKARLLWKSLLLLLDSMFPGISSMFTIMPDLSWLLDWLPGNWFDEDGLTSVPVISQASGAVIGLVPVVGPILDGIAVITGKDQVSGECLSRMSQGVLLASAGATMVFPALLAVKGGLKVGKPLARVLADIPVGKVSSKLQDIVEEFKGRIGWKVSYGLGKVNEVADAYRGMLRIVGKGAISSDELAQKMGLRGFTENNYRESLLRLTGRTSEEFQGFEAHHILPQKFEESFNKAGIENIHDPRLLAWIDEGQHKDWSSEYNEVWDKFFKEKSNATVEDILEEASKLADEHGYVVIFETPGNFLSEWLYLLRR